MDAGLGGFDELWVRLVWFTRLRWLVPPSLLALALVAQLASGRAVVPWLPSLLLLATLLAANAGYRALLRRWRTAPAEHARGLRLVGHAQVLVDLAGAGAALHLTGGPRSSFWPFLSLTVMASALLFGRRGVVALYAAAATLTGWLVCSLDGGGPMPPNAVALATLLAMVAVICVFYAERMEETRRQMHHRDVVLSRVIHELRTPLSALRGFLYVAKKRESAPHSEREQAQTLARIDGQAERLGRMVNDLYDMAVRQSGQLAIEPRACDLVAIVREVSLRFRTLYPRLDLRWRGPDALWGDWDAGRLDQLLTNLVGNAVKYAGESSAIEVTLWDSAGTVELDVHDEGPGIPADKQALIFEPFERAVAPGGARGLGLGLTIAREIALLHGGAIWVDSDRQHGTTFHVRLPRMSEAAPTV